MEVFKIPLNKEQITQFVHLPETGMGYHLVDVHLNDGRVLLKQMILNSSILVIKTDASITNDEIVKIELFNG